MKKLNFFLILSFCCVATFAQVQMIETKDSFTGVTEFTTSVAHIGVSEIQLRKFSGPDSSITLFASLKIFVATSIDNRKSIMLKLKNDELLTLPMTSGNRIAGTNDYLTASALITKEQLRRVVASGVAKLRIETSEFDRDFDFSDSERQDFEAMCRLML